MILVSSDGNEEHFTDVSVGGKCVQALIFDKDGTLVDTERVWYESYVRLLAEFGLVHDLITHRKQMSGSAAECVRILQQAHPDTAFAATPIEELIPRRIEMFRATRQEMGVRPMEGVTEFLEHCATHQVTMAVATSAHRGDTDRELETLGWTKYFRVVVTGDEVPRHKPAPDIFLEAARRLGLPALACAAFEDSGPGIQSAHAAGMWSVLMHDPHFDIPKPQEASLTVRTFRELFDHVSFPSGM